MHLSKLLLKYNSLHGATNYPLLYDISSEKEFSNIIERERERANRNDHQLSLIVFELEAFEPGNLVVKQFIKKAKQRMRKIDEIGFYRSSQIGIVMPYTNFEGAAKYIESLTVSFGITKPIKNIFIYTYPDDMGNKNNS